MKWISRIAISILALVLFSLLIYSVYRYLLPLWPEILFFTYFAAGFVIFAGGMLSFLQTANQFTTQKGKILSTAGKVQPKPGLFARSRDWIAIVTEPLGKFIAWPAIIAVSKRIPMRSGEEVQRQLAEQRLRATEHVISLASLLLIAAVYAGGTLLSGGYGYGRLFILIVGFCVLMRHFTYAVERNSLPTRLRMASASPYALYIAILVSDFVSLVIALTLATTGLPIGAVSLPNLEHVALGILNFREVLNLFWGGHLSLPQLAVAMTGVIFYLGLVRTAFRLKEFVKTDEDYAKLATQHCYLGKFTTALDCLDKMKTTTTDSTITRIGALLGVNNLAQAKVLADRLADGKPDVVFTGFHNLIGACAIFPIPDHVILQVLEEGLQRHLPDALVRGVLMNMISDSAPILEGAQALLAQRAEEYPISRACLLLMRKDLTGSAEILNGIGAQKGLAEVVRLVMLLEVRVSNPSTSLDDDRKAFCEWAAQDLPIIRNELPAITKPIEGIIAYGQLAFAKSCAEQLAPEREQELVFLRDSLKNTATGDEMAVLGFKVVERLALSD